jgi:hypothetical protein
MLVTLMIWFEVMGSYLRTLDDNEWCATMAALQEYMG